MDKASPLVRWAFIVKNAFCTVHRACMCARWQTFARRRMRIMWPRNARKPRASAGRSNAFATCRTVDRWPTAVIRSCRTANCNSWPRESRIDLEKPCRSGNAVPVWERGVYLGMPCRPGETVPIWKHRADLGKSCRHLPNCQQIRTPPRGVNYHILQAAVNLTASSRAESFKTEVAVETSFFECI